MVSERDKSTDGPTSPYDEPTGQIDIPRAAPPDRDDFYTRHARRTPAEMSRVDDLDDLAPDEVETRRAPVTSRPDRTDPPHEDTQPANAVSADRVPADPPAVDEAHNEPTAIIERPPLVTRAETAPAVAAPYESGRPTEQFSTRRHGSGGDQDDLTDYDGGVPTAAGFGVHHPADDLPVADRHRQVADEEIAEAKAKARRGTLDLGLLLLRVAVGGIAGVHGLQKLFGWWNGPKLSGFQDMLVNSQNTSIGFDSDVAKPLAILGAVSETLGGAMVILGLLTPIGASAILGSMLIATAFKTTLAGGFSFFAADGGVEYELLLVVAAAVIILTGPGLYSLDFPYRWARRPFLGSLLWLLIGIGAAVLIWVLANGTNPLTSPGNPGG